MMKLSLGKIMWFAWVTHLVTDPKMSSLSLRLVLPLPLLYLLRWDLLCYFYSDEKESFGTRHYFRDEVSQTRGIDLAKILQKWWQQIKTTTQLCICIIRCPSYLVSYALSNVNLTGTRQRRLDYPRLAMGKQQYSESLSNLTKVTQPEVGRGNPPSWAPGPAPLHHPSVLVSQTLWSDLS